MSGRQTPHLQCRNGIYYLRVRVPDDLRGRFGRLEVRRSFRLYSHSKARRLSVKYGARVLEIFEMVRAQNLSKKQIVEHVRRCFVELQREVDAGLVPTSENFEYEAAYAAHLCQEQIREIQEQLEGQSFAHPVVGVASQFFDFDQASEAGRQDALSGVARAMVEQNRLFLHRLQDRLMPYMPTDPLFLPTGRGDAPVPSEIVQPNFSTPSSASPSSSQEVRGDNPVGPSLGELVEIYLAQHKRDWTQKTYRGRDRQLRYLTDNFGANRIAGSISAPEIRDFRNAIQRLRSNHAQGVGASFQAKQTEAAAARIAPKTAGLIFEPTKAMFRWAKKEAYIAANPAEDITIKLPKTTKAKKGRRPFSAAELRQLFSAPLFTGSKSIKRRHDVGTHIFKDANYWIPVLGYYTGARLGELVQLHFDDVRLDGPIPFIEITDEHSGEFGTDEHKSVKSQAGVRRVPIHSDLLSLGFREFVERRRQEKRSSKRLFWRIGFGADGQASTRFSKWFARFLDLIGLKESDLVFHSYRHGMEDALRDALQPQYVIDRIIGHSDGAISAQYGDGVSLEVAGAAMEAAKLKLSLVELWRSV